MWRALADCVLEAMAVAERCDDVVSGVAKQPRKSRPQECLVLDEDHPHGSSAVTSVPRVPDATCS